MLEKQIAAKFKSRMKKDLFFSRELVRLHPAEIDLILLDKFSHELISYEFKRKDWKKTFFQALRNKLYCHYSYIVVPSNELKRISLKEFADQGIGLITYEVNLRGLSFKEIAKPEKSDRINRQFKKLIYKKFEVTLKG